MKREELIELNVPEEAIDKIMQINGADIEKAKSALEEKEKALKTKCNSIMPTIQRICVSGCIACDNKNCSPPPVRLNSAIEIRKAIKSKYNIFTYSGCLIAG